MYIRYKSLSNDKISIINLDIANCEIVETVENKLVINMPKESKKKNATLSFISKEDADKALDKLFITLHNKSPLGNILDLVNLDEEVLIDKKEQGGEKNWQ